MWLRGVPFAREYGGLFANRSFGGAQVSRTFYAKGQTGQQLLLGAYSSLNRQIQLGKVKSYNRYEMHDVVMIDGRARGIIAKNLVTGKFERFAAHAVVIATAVTVTLTSFRPTQWDVTVARRGMLPQGRILRKPRLRSDSPPPVFPVHGDKQSKLTLMSEPLRNDGRIWVPKKLEDAQKLQAGEIRGSQIPRRGSRLLSSAASPGIR